MSALIRNYVPADQALVDQLVRDAWSELALLMPGWPELAPRLQALTANADASEVIVAELDGQLVGAVGYVGPRQPKQDFFQADWPIVRLMSVAPQARGHGVGRTLLQACIARARRDQCALIALHTTPVMGAAQHLYRQEGFKVLRELPHMYGVPYVLMVRPLSD
jgi:ribosomal protein S18 acetylase RimI-like enzyme